MCFAWKKKLFLATCMLPFPLVQWLSAPLWWIFNKGLFLSPSEELIKVIEARADEPHHPDLEATLSPPPHNYTCIIRTCMHTHTHVSTHTYTSFRQPTGPQARVPATFSLVPGTVNNHGAGVVSTCAETLSQEGLHCFVEMIFILQPDNRSGVLCLCLGFSSCSVCVFLPVSCSPPSPFPSFLCLPLPPMSPCLQSDVTASVQKRRRLGIWWCGACKWSLCQGCLF